MVLLLFEKFWKLLQSLSPLRKLSECWSIKVNSEELADISQCMGATRVRITNLQVRSFFANDVHKLIEGQAVRTGSGLELTRTTETLTFFRIVCDSQRAN